MQAYRIADEPRPSTLNHLAVNPFWPLLGLMLGGAWLAFPWYILNGIAIGSPTIKKEGTLSAIALMGALAIAAGLHWADELGKVTATIAPYALLLLTIWKLGLGYWIYVTQARTFSIYEYFGGMVRNGLFIVILAMFFGRRLAREMAGDNQMLILALF